MSQRRPFRRGVPSRMLDRTLQEVSPKLPEEHVTELTTWLDESIRFMPRQSEALVLGRIEEAVGKMMLDLFGYADAALERFYQQVQTGEVDEDGRLVEDWSRLDGMMVEECIQVLQRVIYRANDEVAELSARALFAYTVQEDEFAQAWHDQKFGGTVDDKRSRAKLATKDSRYYYIVVWSIYHRASQKLATMKEMKSSLEFMRSRFIKDQSPSFEASRDRGHRSGRG